MLSANLTGVLFALTSALVWGGGDFSGGLATRRNNQFQVLALSTLSGIVLLLAFATVWKESIPSPGGVPAAAVAGVSGAIGVAALYRALSLGNVASVAPTAAVVAALPVLFSMLTEGLPGAVRLAGFSVAFLGIWLVSRSSMPDRNALRHGFLLAVVAGVGFGGFFILIAQVEPGKVLAPLLIARLVSFCTALLMLLVRRMSLPSLTSNPIALLAGVLDAGGNIFYLLAKQFARLDMVVVLSSLYPAATVLLAYVALKQDVSRAQWTGVALCLVAVALIAL